MIRVAKVKIEEDSALDVRRITGYLKVPRIYSFHEKRLILEYPRKFEVLGNIGEAIVFSLLPIAYDEACDIELPDEVAIEKETQERIDKICVLWNKLFFTNRKVKIHAGLSEDSPENNGNRHAAQLFSGGIDALATLIRHRSYIRYLIFVHGSDIGIANQERLLEVKKYLEKCAEIYNKELVVIRTNYHYLGYASWDWLAHGLIMLSATLALSNYIDRIFIASSRSGNWSRNVPWGSHPEVDPLVRCNKTEVIHDAFEMKRVEKVKLIHSQPELLTHIRVCNNEYQTGYNCGHCEKCYRTAMVLNILGVNPEKTSFPKETFSLSEIADFIKNNKDKIRAKLHWCENLDFLKSSQDHIPGKDRLINVVQEFLGDFYSHYKYNFPSGLPESYHCINRWRKLEKKFSLKPDSLFGIERLARFFQRSNLVRQKIKN
jgi:hypothetical protein